MSRQQFDTSTPAMAETTLARQTEAPEAGITHSASHDPLVHLAPGAGGVPSPPAQAAALTQASGGRLTRAGRSLLQLQRINGNRYVQRVVSQTRLPADPAPVTQTKLGKRPTTADEDVLLHPQTIQRLHGDDGGAVHQENRTGMPDALKAGLERLSGLDLSGVRVHYNSAKPVHLQALAYTQGQDIHVGPGQEKHLPHEAWHAVQQMQGRVRPTMQAQGVSINDETALEREADVMGMKALQARRPDHAVTGTVAQPVTTVQRVRTRAASAVPIGTSVDREFSNLPSRQARTSPIGREVVQLSTTNFRFDANITGNHSIVAAQHTRSAVHGTAAKWVLTHGAWGSVPDYTVCNHSKPYGEIDQKILNATHNQTLSYAADYVTKAYTYLKNQNQGLGAATSTHSNRMQTLINSPAVGVNVDDVLDSFNYYIYKIGDYPRNLFFWPDTTGGNPDLPAREYGNDNRPHSDWEVNNKIVSNLRRLREEKQRLRDGRADLNNALP